MVDGYPDKPEEKEEEAPVEETPEIEKDEAPTEEAPETESAPKPEESVEDLKKEGTPKDGNGIIASKQVKEDLAKYKTKVAVRLLKALEGMSPEHAYRSPDLVPLTADFQDMKKKLKALITSAKAYQAATLKVEDARSKLYEQYSFLSKDSPLYEFIGKEGDPSKLEEAPPGKDDAVASLATLQKLASMHSKTNEIDYQLHVLDYVTEWEEVVSKMIKQELLMVKKLQKDRTHYEKKVESLRKGILKKETSGKEIKDAEHEKLSRNEKKLKDAWQIHEQKAGEVCFLIEQITIHGWKDFYPLVKNTMKWEVNRLGRENLTYGRLPETLEALKARFVAETLKESE